MNEWYFAKNGQQNGPVTLEQLRDLARSGGLDSKDLVWNGSMKDWTPAGQVAGIFAADASAATPAPPADPSNPYAAPHSTWTEPAPVAGGIVPGSEPIDVGACVKRGFELTKRNFANILLVGLTYVGIFLAVALIMGAIDAALGIGGTTTHTQWQPGSGFGSMSSYQQTTTNSPSILNSIVTNVISVFLTLGLIRIGLDLVSGRQITVGMLFTGGRFLVRAIGASILYGLMVGIGFLLLVVPGIYLALRYGQYLTAIVDRNMGIMESLSYSSSITTNNRMNLFLLTMAGIAIAFAGLLACGIGLFFAYPVVGLSWIVAYRWMQYGHRAAMDQPGTRIPMLAGQ